VGGGGGNADTDTCWLRRSATHQRSDPEGTPGASCHDL